MARKINSRLKICGILRAETPLHVGGYGESFETDMALAKNGNDEFYVPGTSLGGTLRSWFENAFGKDETLEVWGCQENDKQKVGTKNDRSKASFVLIEDMPLGEKVESELRDGVGIDRFYGTAADGAKYDRAILPKGTELKFEMTVEIQENAPKIKAMFGHLLEALQKGEIRLGASKTRGLGKIKLEAAKIKEDKFIGFDILETLKAKTETKEEREKRFTEFGKFKTALKEIAEGETISNYKRFKPNPSEQIKINIEWKPKSPLMVKAGYEGIGVDTLPLVSVNGKDKVSLCLPGSSVKGAFRAHAEKILRTFSEKSVKGDKFDKQIHMPLIDELFGAKKDVTKDSDSEIEKNRKKRLGLGALSVDDCFAEKKMDVKVWQEVETGEFPNEATYSNTDLHQALRKVDLNKYSLNGEEILLTNNEKQAKAKDFHISHHTAIDRFTGAANDGALYSVLKPSPTIKWENLLLSLDLNRISHANKLSTLMLLLLVLRDFAETRLPLGFATNRGMGEVKDVSFRITGAYNIGYRDGDFDFIDDENADENNKLKNEIQTEWEKWITKNQILNS